MTPLRQPRRTPESVTDAGAFLARLETLSADSDYDWAADTINGIYETVEKTGTVTSGQLTAIDNIEEGGKRHRRRW